MALLWYVTTAAIVLGIFAAPMGLAVMFIRASNLSREAIRQQYLRDVHAASTEEELDTIARSVKLYVASW